MSRRQKAILIFLVVLPSIIGIALVVSGGSSGGDRILSSAPGMKKIGLLRLNDVIFSSDRYVDQLRDFRDDNTIAAVILRINSPGGTVAPSQEIYAEVMRYRASNKPLVVSMENVAASGGYYVAAPAHKIFANPGTITGSLGVYMRFPQYYKLGEKVGIGMSTVKAGKYKDVGNPYREMTPEERQLLQNLIEDTHDQFINDVAAARSLSADSVRRLADGRIFTGRQAWKVGLVDSIGGYQDVVAYVKHEAGLPERTRVVEKKPRASWLTELLSESLLGRVGFLRDLFLPAGGYFLLQMG